MSEKKLKKNNPIYVNVFKNMTYEEIIKRKKELEKEKNENN